MDHVGPISPRGPFHFHKIKPITPYVVVNDMLKKAGMHLNLMGAAKSELNACLPELVE